MGRRWKELIHEHTVFLNRVKYRTKGLKPKHLGEQEVHDRHTIVTGWDQDKIHNSKIAIVGCGGLGGIFSWCLARMGLGGLILCDSDIVQLSNLPRQYFYEEQISQNKALSLAENLKRNCTASTIIEAYPLNFQQVREDHYNSFLGANIIACLVDNNETRYDVSEYGLKNNMPVIISAVSKTTRNGYVFVQEKNEACFNCIYPRKDTQISIDTQCRDPAIIYTHMGVMSLAVYATVSKILGWKLHWNYYDLFLNNESVATIRPKRKDCVVCSKEDEND